MPEQQLTPIKLLPLPVGFRQALRISRQLARELEDYGLDEMIQQRLQRIYTWDQIQDPTLRRFFRNYSRAYTSDELRSGIKASLDRFLSVEEG